MHQTMASFVVGLAGVAGLAMGDTLSQEPLRLKPVAAQLVVVDAFVTDNKGRPVSNLVAADFDLLDDHKNVQIVGFEAPRTGAVEKPADTKLAPGAPIMGAASTPDAEVMVIFIDRKLLSPGGRRLAIQQSGALASDHVKAGGRVVVVAEDRTLRP